jgi:hypothetical protein
MARALPDEDKCRNVRIHRVRIRLSSTSGATQNQVGTCKNYTNRTGVRETITTASPEPQRLVVPSRPEMRRTRRPSSLFFVIRFCIAPRFLLAQGQSVEPIQYTFRVVEAAKHVAEIDAQIPSSGRSSPEEARL